MTLVFLFTFAIGNVWAGDSFPKVDNFENGTCNYGKSNATSIATNSTKEHVRTGEKSVVLQLNTSSGGPYTKRSTKFSFVQNTYIHAIGWIKSDDYEEFWFKLASSNGTKVKFGGDANWHQITAAYQYTSATSDKEVAIYITSDKKGNKVYYDDIVYYSSNSDVTDTSYPNGPTAGVSTTTAINWTNRDDSGDGATGRQATLIWKRKEGSANDLTLNNQGVYSLTDTEGPSTDQSGHWTLVTASVAADATSYAGTFVAGDVYAIVHRDLAYNYSTPAYVTITAGATYDATFANGGHGTAPAKAEGVSSVTLTELTESGWTNTGWTANKATKVGTTDKAAGATLNIGDVVTLLENTTFTAQWAQLYTVTYNKAGGEGGDVPTQEALINGAQFDVAGQGTLTPAITGQIFRGWSDGTAATPYKEGDEYTIAGANVNFTAVWETPVNYTITLDAKGGSVASYEGWTKDGDVYSKTVVEGTEVSLLAFTKTGLQLMFFRDGSANEYSGSVTLNSDLNLSAVWGEEKEVEIYYWEGAEGGAIERGGTAVSVDKDGNPTVGNADVNASVSTYYTIRVQGKYDYSNPYVKITTDESVKTGDKITFTGFINKNQEKDAAMLMKAGDKVLFAETTSLPNIAYPTETPGTPEEREYTISTTDVDATVLDLMRNNGHSGTNCFVTKLAITGTRVVEVKDPCETPLITTQPVGGTYNWNADPSMSVTASAPDGGTLKYQWYKKGTPDAKVGTNSNAFTPTESGTYYVIVTNTKVGYGDADLKSNEVEVTINARPSYTVTYYDGASKLGEEDVLEADYPADYEDYQAKAIYGISGLYTFEGWFNNSDLAEGHKIADVAALAIGKATNIYGKWTKKYAENVDIAAYAAENVDDDSSNDAEELAAFKTWFTGKGYVHANLNGLDKTTSNNGAYAGIKTKSNAAYYAFNVVANKRVTIKLGYMAAAAEMYINGVKNTTQALTGGSTSSGDNYADWYYDVTEESTLQLKIVNGGTCVLKAVTIGEIPALSDDATLSDLTLKYGEEDAATITDFSSGKYIYNVVMPYGTTKAELPIVGATATQGAKSLVTINQAKDREDWKTVIRVQAEDRVDEHDKYYEVRFIVEPKQGVSIIKATTQKVVTGYIGGTAVLTKDGSAQSGSTYKLDSKVTFGITLADGKKFKEGDVFVMNITVAPGSATSMGTMKVYDAADATEPIYETDEVGSEGVNYWTLPAAAEGKTSLYIKRGDGKDWNPTFSYVEVRRLMAPVIKSFKIGEEVGAINESTKTIAVEVPYGTAVNALTPEIEYYGNGDGAIDKTGAQDFSSPVTYKVSSAYAEDATGDYAPVTYTVTVTVADHYEAKIGDVGYATLVEAVAAAVDGDVIVLQENVTAGAGVMIAKADAKQITIDFGGFTYKAVSPGVGSVGTQNQAFHFEKGCDITLKNGTITSEGSEIKMLIQNYGDLTLENITLDGAGLPGSHAYVLSNNCGDVEIGDGATITAKTGDVAFDVCATNYYPEGVTVTVKEGATISGIVEYDVWGTKPADNKAELAIEGGTLNITWNVESALAEDAKANLNVSGGVFNAAVPEDYCAPDYAPTSWMVGTETKYGVHLAGVIRGEAVNEAFDTDNIPMYTLDNGVKIYSSGSNGQVSTSSNFSTGSDVEVCGGDAGKYAFTSQHMILKFPKNVSGFKIFGTGSTQRSINKVYSNATAGTAVQIKNVGVEHTGTFTGDKEQTAGKWCQYVEAVFDANNTIAKDEYVYVNLNGSMYAYRVIFTEAPCIDPVINSIDATRMKVGEQATVSVDASAVGATYQWYRCSNAAGDNAAIITGATAASYSFTKAAGDEYFKVVVGCNCNDVKVEAVVKAEEWYEVIRTNVTGYTEWNWNGIADTDNGPTINDSQKGLVLASYIDAPNFDKLEGVNSARVYRSNQYPAYQGTQLKFTTEVPGMLIIDASYQDNGNTFSVNGYPMGTLPKNHAKDTIAVKAGDVTITSQGIRIWAMTFDPDFSNYALTDNKATGYDRPVTEGRYGTICLPNGGVMVGAELYEVAYYDGTVEKIFLDEVLNGEMVAGRPYIFLTKEGVDKIAVFYTDGANASAGDYHGLFGSYSRINLDANANIYILKDNRYYLVDSDNVYCGENRAYFKMGVAGGISGSYVAPAPGRKRMSIGAGAPKLPTGIENTGFESEAPRKVLINGELYILRGEKMYDAKGQLVK